MAAIKFTLIGLVILYILIGLVVYLFQEKLIFLPEKLERNFEYEFPAEFTEHFIQMKDGSEINALHFTNDESKGLILYFHGNAGSLRRWGEVVLPFVDLGYEVLIVDYRGYGKSTGSRSYSSMLSDADELYQFATTLAEEERLIVFGRSLGSSFASYLAGKYNPSKLILETPFYSLGDIAKNVLPLFPQKFFLRFDFRNYETLKGADCPIYIFHGTNDNVVPLESGQKLFETLVPEQAQMFVIEGGGHNNLSGFEDYRVQMNNVLTRE